MQFIIEPMLESDWETVRAIYLEGIDTGDATFEAQAPSWEEWDKKHVERCRLVARHEGKVFGWAALGPVSDRCVYAGVAEISIYVSVKNQRRGIGEALLKALINESEHLGFWTLQSGILRENVASIVLHKKCGFREVGTRERLGRLNGVWRDVVLMERRSNLVGTNRPT